MPKSKKMVKIKMTRNAVAGGKPRVIGEPVDVSENEARFLTAIKKAVIVVECPKGITPAPIECPQIIDREKDIKVNTRKGSGKGRNRRIKPDNN
ncbi:MAG: hypothetical protein GY771_01120 [bacterium]|nr:hypothetical protein [bacterium]